MTLNAMPFAPPFRVELQGGLERIFLNVYDALDFLENEWPIRSGAAYQRALEACRNALEDGETCTAARFALLDACEEAGLNCPGLTASPKAAA